MSKISTYSCDYCGKTSIGKPPEEVSAWITLTFMGGRRVQSIVAGINLDASYHFCTNDCMRHWEDAQRNKSDS